MSAKISAARRAAFLKALARTGNQTVSAERAQVSRSWVTLQRTGDAGFDAACRDALAEAKARLGAAGARRPPTGWGSLDGVSMVVRGTGGSGGGKRVQIGRARLKQWCPRTEARFLGVLAATCNVKAACASVGMWPPSAYNHRGRWPVFAKAWDAAIEEGYARLEAGLLEHAGNMFCARDVPPAIDMPPMRVDEAIHLLHMHQRRVHAIGGAPGRAPRVPTIAEVEAKIDRHIDALERGRRVAAGRRARDEAEWARRREGVGP